MANEGKRFERQFKESADKEGILCVRFNDSDMSFNPNKEFRSRFTAKNPADFFIYRYPYVYFLELKSTKYKSISFEREKGDQGMIHLPRGAGLAAARRAINNYMLRIRPAHCRPKGPYAVLLPHYLVHPARPCLFRQGSIQRSLSHAFQFLHLPALGAGLALALHRLSHPAGTAVSVPNISKHSQLKQYPYPNRAV